MSSDCKCSNCNYENNETIYDCNYDCDYDYDCDQKTQCDNKSESIYCYENEKQYHVREVKTKQKKNSEININFCENNTSGYLTYTIIKGNIKTGHLQIKIGNCINLSSDLFKGMLSLSIFNNTNNKVLIKNKPHITLKPNNYCLLKKNNLCKLELVSIYEINTRIKKKCNYSDNSENSCDECYFECSLID